MQYPLYTCNDVADLVPPESKHKPQKKHPTNQRMLKMREEFELETQFHPGKADKAN